MGQLVGGCCGGGGGGGGSHTSNKVTWGDNDEYYVDGETETVVAEWNVNFDDCGAASIQARLSAFVKVGHLNGGIYNLRVGGTRGAADGTIRATFTSTSESYEQKTNQGAAFANPGGQQIVKLTTYSAPGSGTQRTYVQGAEIAIG